MEIKDMIALSIGGVILLIIVGYLIFHQRTKVIKWLIWAVTEAEKQLGEKTGQLKLHTVWSWFCEKFPAMSAILPFKVFSAWVDVALDTFKAWLETNRHVADYIGVTTNEDHQEEQF